MKRNDVTLTEEEIKNKIERFFSRDNRLNESEIDVSVTGSSVKLEGKVRSREAFRAAENDAYTVMGVKTVNNNLQLVPPETHRQPSDPEIEQSVSSTLIWNTQVNSGDIRVVADEGVVELEGSVNSYYQKRLAEELASNINGVKDVRNNLIINVRDDVNDELIADRVFESLDTDPLVNVNELDVSVNNGLVTLSGNVQDYAAANAAHDALLYIPGVRGIVNQITIG